MTQIISALSEIADQYDALFVDLWGCVHNGVKAFPAANQALKDYRKTGGKVVLVTNSPKPRAGVQKQLVTFGVDDEAWDTIASSGDSARSALYQGAVGQDVYFIGEPRDLPFFDPLKILDDPMDIRRVSLEQAEGIVCTGPFDAQADPQVMRKDFSYAQNRGLKLLCANPDIIVDRGNTREWCAGALAKLYTEMGGESLYFGKPHAPIYDLARRRLAAMDEPIPDTRILAIGDGIQTDIKGATDEGIDALFISGGLAAEETKTENQPNPDALNSYLAAETQAPRYTIGFLR